MIVEELKKSLYLSAFNGELSKCLPTDSNVLIDLTKIIDNKKINSKEEKRRKIKKISAELPELPQNWKWVQMGYLCDVIRGLTFSSTDSYKQDNENRILVLRGGNIDSKTENLIYSDNIYVNKNIPNSSQFLKKNDILIVASSGTKTSVGKSAFIEKIDENVSFGGFMMVIRPYSKIANPKYIMYNIKSYRNKIINDTNGYISNVTNEILNNLLIPLPPIEEQQRIVDKIEELFSKLDEIKPIEENLNNLKKSFQMNIKESILFNNVTGLKDSNKLPINKYYKIALPQGWSWKKFGELTNCRMGKTILTRDLISEGIPVYSATNSDNVFGFVKNSDLILKHGDIVIPARGNSIGYATLITDKIATCTQTTIACFPNEQIDSKYLYYCCYAFKKVWFKYSGSAIPQITISKINENYVPLPPIEEQKRIVEKLEELLPLCNDIENLVR